MRYWLPVAAGLGIAGANCDRGIAPAAERSKAEVISARDGVLALVNGVAITDVDVRMRAEGAAHGNAGGPGVQRGVLATLVREELARQRATALGLDREPDYLRKVAKMEAELEAFKRSELSAAFLRKEVDEKAKVSDREARQYFVRHQQEVKSEFHVLQILHTRDRKATEHALEQVRGGEDFESVAKRRFAKLSLGAERPWDLGFLKWNQLPDAWWGVIFDMKPGDVSEVITGPEERTWVIKLVARRDVPGMDFETVKPRILAVLERQAAQRRRAAAFTQLTQTANIVYTDPSLAAP